MSLLIDEPVPIPFIEKLNKIATEKILKDGNEFGVFFIKAGEFVQDFPNWKIDLFWDKQRPIDADKVAAIHKTIRKGPLRYLNMNITIGAVRHEKPRVMDGNHRLHALTTLDASTPFRIEYCNFDNEDELFVAFLKLNDNTPLPEFFKAVTDKDGFYRELSKTFTQKFTETYHKLFTVPDNPYYLSEHKLQTQLYATLKRNNVPMSTEDIVGKLLHELNGFKTHELDFKVIPANADWCEACANRSDWMRQCNYKPRKDGRCGIHMGSTTPSYDPYIVRNNTYKELTRFGYGYFTLDPEWINTIVTRVFVPKKQVIKVKTKTPAPLVDI